MASTNGKSNVSYKGLSRPYQLYPRITSTKILTNVKVINKSEFQDVLIDGTLRVAKQNEILISSKNNLTDGGFVVGIQVQKDMDNNNYTNEFDPNNYQSSFFPDMADFIDGNIVAGDKEEGDRLTASYWNDLGNDVFDDWGYFYLYDVNSGKYYFPLIDPQNQENGIISTQTFAAFGRTFTITHGWCVQGIFKFDISVSDTLPFRFGSYGNMGSDGDEVSENLSQSYTLNETNMTLYYHHHAESGDIREVLYSYFVPKTISENNLQTYFNIYENDDDMSIVSNEVTSGLIVYFSKGNDVKDWVINDLEVIGGSGSTSSNRFLIDEFGNSFVKGNAVAGGKNLSKMVLTSMNGDLDHYASSDSLINGYFTSQNMSDNRMFIIPSAASLIASIPNCLVNTSFRFIINNVQDSNYIRTLSTVNGSVTIDPSCLNTSIPRLMIFSYIIIITNITQGIEAAKVYQDCNTVVFG